MVVVVDVVGGWDSGWGQIAGAMGGGEREREGGEKGRRKTNGSRVDDRIWTNDLCRSSTGIHAIGHPDEIDSPLKTAGAVGESTVAPADDGGRRWRAATVRGSDTSFARPSAAGQE